MPPIRRARPPKPSCKRGGTTPSLKNNQAELKDWAEHLMRYPVDDEHAYHQVRSGSLWVWRVRSTAQILAEKDLSFPGPQQIIQIYRHKIHKRTGAISEETLFAITNLSPTQADAATLALISRNHWESRTSSITNGTPSLLKMLVAPTKLPKP